MVFLTNQAASSSSSSFTRRGYDVFLSFRVEETRSNFISHLYKALCDKGFDTYVDNNLQRGEEIPEQLLKVIDNSMILMIIFSKNYAFSSWCMNELVKITECRKNGQLVLPIFYKVNPLEVRNQTGKFGEALAKHLENFTDIIKVQRWKKALNEVSSLSGFHYTEHSYSESNFIQGILKSIVGRSTKEMPLFVAKYPVGINSRVEAIKLSLDIESNDVRMVVIYGSAGVGKTTIAKAIYNIIFNHFEQSSFLENVSNKSQANGVIQLQETLLSKILGDNNLKIQNVSVGINMIKRVLLHKKVLLILDDVDKLDQIEKLLGKCDWFAPGTRIIITTSDKYLLDSLVNVDLSYKVNELDDYEALELFSRYAFQTNTHAEDFLELAEQVVVYAKGLPLALTIMGASFFGRSKQEWENALDKYKRIPKQEIQEILKLSYEGLDGNAQEIFLNIACFFNGFKKDNVEIILDGLGLYAVCGLAILIDKCLITIGQFDELLMHDILQQMGQEIVLQESPQKPRSRLLTNYKELKQMGRIMLPDLRQTKLEDVMFKRIRNLTFHNMRLREGFQYLLSILKMYESGIKRDKDAPKDTANYDKKGNRPLFLDRSRERKMAKLSLESLPLGFRFRPTDKELITHYLRLKNQGHDSGVIAKVDFYKFDPWELPDLSAIKLGNEQWFFFCELKIASRLNKTTKYGYWKVTGKDRHIKSGKSGSSNSSSIGIKKTLVYHTGHDPKGKRTNWVVYEYHAIDTHQDGFILCHLFKADLFSTSDRIGSFRSEETSSDKLVWGKSEAIPLRNKASNKEASIGYITCLFAYALALVCVQRFPQSNPNPISFLVMALFHSNGHDKEGKPLLHTKVVLELGNGAECAVVGAKYMDLTGLPESLFAEEGNEKQILLEPQEMVFDTEAVDITSNSSKQTKSEIEVIEDEASQRWLEGLTQQEAVSTLKPQVVFDVEAVKVPKFGGWMKFQIADKEESEANRPQEAQLFLMQVGLRLTEPPKDEDWENANEIYLMDNELSVLPENPRCPKLSALFLQRNYKLRLIPPSFFDNMPALQTLNLSRTNIKSLPNSIVRLVSLKRLFLNYCHCFMVLSPKIGELKQLEVLSLEGTEIMDLPLDIKKLTNLTCLEVSFCEFQGNCRQAMQLNAVVPCGVISVLSQLEELNIDVDPGDERWDACVEDIVNEVCTLKRLYSLKLYFQRVELLSHIQQNIPSLLYFRFTVGRHLKRIMSGVPCDVELELERWDRCLKYINGVDVPEDIKEVLQHSTAFFLDRHATVKKLSNFGIENMEKLKCLVMGECSEVQVIIDDSNEIVSKSYGTEKIVLGSLEYMYVYYMESLRSMWEGPLQPDSFACLKSLTLCTCPQLTTIFTPGLLANLCKLKELKVDDCCSIKSIVSRDVTVEHKGSYFLPELKKISLHYVPELDSISNGLHIAPKLEWLSFYDCPKLKNPLVGEVSSQCLKKIKGETSWWEALEWSNGRPGYLDEIFVPIDICDC
ncbi:hypothetical protein SO802_000133 [Lithocarpus litseifolius]|uniref:Uncharacterized protein n=1 Tax=Lithocarpus litseifolius TaxID=425828 RepID=A0AAW2DSI2_9ROSI